MAYSGSEEKECSICDVQWARYVRARDNGHNAFIALANKCEDFYRGDQWDPKVIKELNGRPYLTVNLTKMTVDAVCAEQQRRKADIKFKPLKSGKQTTADVISKVWDQIAADNRFHWLEQDVFADGLILDGRGFYDMRIDFTHNLMGTVKIECRDPRDILLDPDAKEYDPKTWTEVFYTRWSTLDEIEATYGKKYRNKLQFIGENGTAYSEDSVEISGEKRFGDTQVSRMADGGLPMYSYGTDPTSSESGRIRRCRVVERQYIKMARVDFFTDPLTGDQQPVPEGWDEKKASKFAKKFNLSIISKMDRRVRWTVTCDKVCLHDDWSPYRSFTIVPFFAYFRRGKPFGMVRNLISPQEQLNKAASQELHIINTTANSGWLIESGSLTSLKPEDLEVVGAKTGVVIEFNRGSTPPEKILPNVVPPGLERISQQAQQNIKQISGVTDLMLSGNASTDEFSQQMMNRGTLTAQTPLENLAKTRTFVGEKALELIQDFYTEERILFVAEANTPEQAAKPTIMNQEGPDGSIINDLTQGEYNVIVASVPAHDAFEDMQYEEALRLREAGVAIPDDAIIQYSHLADKVELAKRIRAMTGIDLTPEQQQMEMIKEQLAMQQLQLTVQELAAKVQKLQASAAVDMAKVQDMADVQPQLELQKLQTELEARTRELDLRRELATLSAQARDTQTQTAAATKIATTAMGNATRREMAKEKGTKK